MDVHDPWAKPAVAERQHGPQLIHRPQGGSYNAILLAIEHRQFRELGSQGISAFDKPHSIVSGVKHILSVGDVDGRLSHNRKRTQG